MDNMDGVGVYAEARARRGGALKQFAKRAEQGRLALGRGRSSYLGRHGIHRSGSVGALGNEWSGKEEGRH